MFSNLDEECMSCPPDRALTQLHYSPSCGHGMQIGIAASLRITHGGVARLCGVSEHYVLGLPAYVTLTALVF